MNRKYVWLIVIFVCGCVVNKEDTERGSGFFGQFDEDVSRSVVGIHFPEFTNGTGKRKVKRYLKENRFKVISETENRLVVKSSRKKHQHATATYTFMENMLNNISVNVEVELTKKKSARKTPYLPLVGEEQQKVLAQEVVNKVNTSMLSIPSGNFVMGCIEYDFECDENEKPAHYREIDGFRMMKHEITWDIYSPCVFAGICPDYRKFSESRGDIPVVNVNWNDIVNLFIPWLNKYGNQQYRLPSEAEWEYAARAGTKTIFSWGDKPSGEHANGSQKNGWPDDGFEVRTSPVMNYTPNMFGLYDMTGNVWEWVQDCWNDIEYKSLLRGGQSNNDRGECKRRVLRGGSWGYKSNYLRNSMRYLSYADSRFGIYGFRLVAVENNQSN